jgi:hypothetical protein
MRLKGFLPLLLVLGLLVAAVVAGPFKITARDAVPWPALTKYYDHDFHEAGFTTRCVMGSRETCLVRWNNPGDPAAQPINVYSFADDQEHTREDVLQRFYKKARDAAGEAEAQRAVAVLDGFFQSGLRRLADRALHRARDGSAEAFRLPPFRLSDTRRVGRIDIRDVEGLDSSYSTIATGLPRRPVYRADILAASGGGTTAGSVSVRLVAADGNAVTQALDSAASATCPHISPEGSDNALVCRSVTVTGCEQLRGFACGEPVVEIHAIAPGVALVRSAGSRFARLLSRGGEPLNLDEVMLVRTDDRSFEPLYVQANRNAKIDDFRLELARGGDLPISRQRMVNGRWERWFEPTSRPWIEPVVNRWEQLALTNAPRKVDPVGAVHMSLDLSYQQALETKLAGWMKTNVEPEVVAHLERDHYPRRDHQLNYAPDEPAPHRRPIPHAGVTVLDAQTGSVLAVASYPPASALTMRNGQPAFGQGWRERLAGTKAPDWARRELLEILSDRLANDTNANFITHPIGSTFKPVLLSLMIDAQPRGGLPADSLGELFNLVIAGHPPKKADTEKEPIVCPACADPSYEAVAGLPVGPYGEEEGSWIHRSDPWIDRADFLLASCNKYAVTLGVLSLFEQWGSTGNNAGLCCWNPRRDSFAFVLGQSPGGKTSPPQPQQIYNDSRRLPPLGPWLDHTTFATTARFPEAPVFARLSAYYDVPARSQPDAFDPLPWARCIGIDPYQNQEDVPRMGTVNKTQLMLTGQIVGASFTNLFTGAGHNWWSSLKLAEAYARLSEDKQVVAGFCGGSSVPGTLFSFPGRHSDIVQILSHQHEASWVHVPEVEKWLKASPGRTMLSKTGTTLRSAGYSSTGVFATFIGNSTQSDGAGPMAVAKGIVVVAYVDDLGKSERVTKLLDFLFATLQKRLEP